MSNNNANTEIHEFYLDVLPKREARESAFILVFENIFNPDETLDKMLEVSELSGLFQIDGFSKNLVKACFENVDEIDNIIKDCLVNWSYERISNVSKGILRLATAELLYKKTETVVIFNEYVELSKKYGDEKESSFINGVLGSVAKKVRN